MHDHANERNPTEDRGNNSKNGSKRKAPFIHGNEQSYSVKKKHKN